MFIKLDRNMDFYKKALDGSWERHKTITGNIANVNTPNYKRKHTSFEDQLKSATSNYKLKLDQTHRKHLPIGKRDFKPITKIDKADSYRIDGNNVNIDIESGELAKNNILYDALTRQVSSEFEKLKNVIAEGSK